MNNVTNRYLVKFKPSRMREVLKLIMSTFDGWKIDFNRQQHIGMYETVYCYFYLVDGKSAQIIMQSDAINIPKELDHELPTYTDIPMLPLMDVGISEGKKHENLLSTNS